MVDSYFRNVINYIRIHFIDQVFFFFFMLPKKSLAIQRNIIYMVPRTLNSTFEYSTVYEDNIYRYNLFIRLQSTTA